MNKWYEDAGHVVLGIIPLDLLLWVREWTKVKLPWPYKGQWPPGDPYTTSSRSFEPGVKVTQLDRVADIGRDTLGYDIGRTIRFLGLLAWGLWGTFK